MIPPVQTLVRYDNPAPILAISNGKKGDVPKAAPVSQTEDILNAILKPRYATPLYPLHLIIAHVIVLRSAFAVTQSETGGSSITQLVLLVGSF